MSVTTLTGVIVCFIAPLLVASRRVTAGGKVGWFFLTVAATLLTAGLGGLIVAIANGSVYDMARGSVGPLVQGAIDLGGLFGAVAGTALMFYIGDQKSRLADSKSK
ncbi:MAG TPA: hypothetical protein VE959_28545 [Bryobacteraceae bacterium]|nr:hypothetical protein [Bryobacteraceae bacterium]